MWSQFFFLQKKECSKTLLNQYLYLQDDRFPDGLAVGGEKCQSVMGLPVIKGDGTITGKWQFKSNYLYLKNWKCVLQVQSFHDRFAKFKFIFVTDIYHRYTGMWSICVKGMLFDYRCDRTVPECRWGNIYTRRRRGMFRFRCLKFAFCLRNRLSRICWENK